MNKTDLDTAITKLVLMKDKKIMPERIRIRKLKYLMAQLRSKK